MGGPSCKGGQKRENRTRSGDYIIYNHMYAINKDMCIRLFNRDQIYNASF